MTPATPEYDSETKEPVKTVRDLRRELSDQIIDMLNSGPAPWQKPWNESSLGLRSTQQHRMSTVAETPFTS